MSFFKKKKHEVKASPFVAGNAGVTTTFA